jgi:tRNA modification GTPase
MGSRPCQAAVITPPGTAAIGGILLCGAGAREILQAIFRTTSPGEVLFEPGRIFVGQITDGSETIDQVVIGCEGPDRFAIHCHGNPLLVESLMELFARRGAELISADALLRSKAVSEETTTIAAEAKVERLKTVTMEGFCLISNQIEGGLSRWAKDTLDKGEAISIPDIQEQCRQILADSRIARRIIHGCRAAIVGPPNSGKSTLFNRLCGASKSIVADIGGTTRDWVSAIWRMPSLRVELFDTAGLEETLAAADPLQAASQQRTHEIIRGAAVLIAVLDGSRPLGQFSLHAAEGQAIIHAINKSDLRQSPEANKLPFVFTERVNLSAHTGQGVEKLSVAVRRATGVDGFDLSRPVCSSLRQLEVVTKLSQCGDPCKSLVLLEQLLTASPPL